MKYLYRSLQYGGFAGAVIVFAAHQPCWTILVFFGIHIVGDLLFIRYGK